jgi:hypothetical protein
VARTAATATATTATATALVQILYLLLEQLRLLLLLLLLPLLLIRKHPIHLPSGNRGAPGCMRSLVAPRRLLRGLLRGPAQAFEAAALLWWVPAVPFAFSGARLLLPWLPLRFAHDGREHAVRRRLQCKGIPAQPRKTEGELVLT